MIDLLIALVLALTMPRPALLSIGSPPSVNVLPVYYNPPRETRTGKLVYYAEDWEAWTCPATERCGIAARQGVTPAAGEWCVATWYREDLNRIGTLRIGTRTWRVRVCDYANPVDLPRILRLRIAGEIPYPLAQEIPGLVENGWTMGTLILAPIVSTMPPVCRTRIPRCSSGHAAIAATTRRPLPLPR